MRSIHLVLLLGGLVLAACGSDDKAPAGDAAVDPADLVIRGGTVASVDPDLGIVEAIAVSGYKIRAVGSDEDIAAYIGPETQIVELKGRFAMPGFIEGHGHYMGYGHAQQILDLTAVKDWDQVVSMVATAADKAAPGEWIEGSGWHQDKWTSVPGNAVDGVPVNDSLNRVSPDNPVVLTHASHHGVFANDKALAEAGIDDNTKDPEGGTIVRDAKGKATGMLRETADKAVAAALERYESRLSPEDRERKLRERAYLAGEGALANGVTSFHDAGTSFETIDFLKLLEQEQSLPVRLYVMARDADNDRLDEMLPHYYMPAGKNDFLTVRSIKRQVDGALGTHGAWLLEPYIDHPGTGLVLESVEAITRNAEIAIKHGFQLNVHAIGDRANREMLNVYEQAFKNAGVNGKDLRWRIEHAQHVDPADLPRFAALGVIASMQGVHATSDLPWMPTRLGEERTVEVSYRWRDLIDSGAVVTNGTDVPVESINPIASFYASVARRTADGRQYNVQQAMTREEALQTYTINNAFAAFEEQDKGSLTPGKLADIVILSQDLLSVPEDRIMQTTIDMTIVGGQVVYEREN